MDSTVKHELIAPNRVPMGAIRLSAAFVLAYRALTPNWEDISYQRDQYDELEARGEETPNVDPHRIEFEATKRAEAAFRSALTNNEISAYISELATGNIVELNPKDWWEFAERPGIWSDYPSPTDVKIPGPDCASGGVRQPVFLMREQLHNWLEKIKPFNRNKRDVILDFRSHKIKKIKDSLDAGPILRVVVAYFLKNHIDGLPGNRQSKKTDKAINELLIRLELRTEAIAVNRTTNRNGYKLAMRIAKITRSPVNWRDLGVPELPAMTANPTV